jgi:hypothetical protein
MKRRTLLQILASTIVALPGRIGLRAQPATLSAPQVARLRMVADVVLPQEIGAAARTRAVDQFLAWLQNYRAGAETDHGYGFPRLRRTAPSPAIKYAEQLNALGAAFTDLAPAERSRVVETAIGVAEVKRLPARPDGTHVVTDLMAFYFNSIEANDVCYRAQIGRDTCRGLEGSGNRPAPLDGGR